MLNKQLLSTRCITFFFTEVFAFFKYINIFFPMNSVLIRVQIFAYYKTIKNYLKLNNFIDL